MWFKGAIGEITAVWTAVSKPEIGRTDALQRPLQGIAR